MSVVILEGVTGAGKSSTIAALQAMASFQLYGEDLTFGDFMSQFWRDADEAARRTSQRLTRILNEIDPKRDYMLERFHFSQIAVGSDPAYYRDINDRCLSIHCKVAVLTVPDERLRSRSLNRTEYGGEDWQSLIEHYGSEEAALRVLRQAQDRRIEAVENSGLTFCLFDSSTMAWDEYAHAIGRWAHWL